MSSTLEGETTLGGKRKDITPLFMEAGITGDPVSIIETKGMYPYKENLEENWAFFTAIGMKRLKRIFEKEGYEVKDIGIVGICSGVEGIAVVYIFKDTLKKLIVTDIDAEILNGTVVNIGNSAKKFGIEVVPLIGSFCEPIEKMGDVVDFVHANVPNLPSSGTEDLSMGAEKGTFLPAQLYEGYNPPEKFLSYAMGAQYAYLQSARKILRPGGTVITELGGRMPLNLIPELFDECGFDFQEVYVGFKEQTEALIDFEGYHKIEEQYGVLFEFYLFEESRKALAATGYTNATSTLSGAEMKRILEPYKISAGKALELYKQGIASGHTVHLFRGIKR
ncbi:MAG: hypothetical protein A2946_04075 [Candidatus Liptonbacteria bacterium RIFCSPLOWO2_01_FULL_53_13]|uniref:Methyltransferase domain-containing protein n=1 Tax=Candidatus Liptonbacteria bacterium RIFCSPLOWO2_01_FULL_53_13 TaxID=1798651 RepID=A0A1G2CQK4_9BACT|nr:MAG: hypothetical protein A2946_04075 [Candidatus Liptonbacteria bacterium RIFCSPLOWO2_01_FULL_53_13]